MGVTIRGLERAKLIPSQIEERLHIFRYALVPPLVEDFKHTEPQGGKWPKGRRKKIQDQTKGLVRGQVVIIGTFHSRFARSLDTGQTVKPRKPGGVMRFRNEEGEFVFTRKRIVHRPRPFYGRVLSQVPTIVGRVYRDVFSRGIGSAD